MRGSGRARRGIVLLWAVATVGLATTAGFGDQTKRLLIPIFTKDFGLEWQAAHDLHNDVRKALHLCAYAAFAGLVWISLRPRKRSFARVLGVVLALATLDEIVQSLTPKRTGRVTDVLLDLGGATVALMILQLFSRCRVDRPISDVQPKRDDPTA